jgi:uncharacterized membrane protein YgdD (TMEM256/DUF423 family)
VVIHPAFTTLTRMRKYVYLAAATGAIGVAAGAFGAHALKETLANRNSISIWNTAVLYNLIHAAALLGTGLYLLEKPKAASWLAKASSCWAVGVGLFSGSLYCLALGGPRWLGLITPGGGLFLILGWLLLIGETGKSPRNPSE